MDIKHRIIYFILGISVAANVGLACTAGSMIQDGNDKAETSNNVYNQNLNTLSARCFDLEQGLSKLMVCNESEQSIRILTDIIDDSGAAVTSLSTLPLYPGYISKLNRYLNHVSDYSKFMLYQSATGIIPSSEYGENIEALKNSVSEVNKALTELENKINASPIEWEKLVGEGATELEMLDNAFSSAIESIQTEGIDYPTLIYDGPFSDSVVNKKIEESGDEITKEDAVEILRKFIKLDDSWNESAADLCSGIINTWCVTFEKDGEYYYGSVAKNSGAVISFINNGQSYEEKLSRDGAAVAALQFLEANGYENMIPQYCQVSNGNATINFVYSMDDVLIYPDMVKVRVNMTDGTVNGFEGMSYYANHSNEREIVFNDEFIIAEAEARLPSSLTVEQRGTAVIPTDGENEILCYEFRCKSGNDMYIVYFDAKTQKQVKIFKILSTENGDFVV